MNSIKWKNTFRCIIQSHFKQSGKKGDGGKIGIIGGCVEFIGPPYYAGMTALRVVG